MNGRLPLIIAHRGASGYLPEHTREAKILAYGQGADYLEQDVVATRDDALVILHDIYLDDVSDVASQYPNRHRADGHFYVIDFELAELRKLRLGERRQPGANLALYPDRFNDPTLDFRIVTLDEELRLIQELDRQTTRTTGIYPEIKRPDWHRQHGIDLADLLLSTLRRHGYKDESDAVFVQSFDADELKRCRTDLGATLKLVQLVEKSVEAQAMLTAAGLAEIASYANVVAPSISLIADFKPHEANERDAAKRGSQQGEGGPRLAPWVAEVRPTGLDLHAYAFRRERVPEGVPDFDALLKFFLGVADGLFCDQPDLAIAARTRMSAQRPYCE